jgi:integrase
MQAGTAQGGGSGFLGQLRQEVLLHKGKRATFVLGKLATVVPLLALGVVQIAGLENRWLLYTLPFVALAFDVYIAAEDFRVKRVGAFLRAYADVPRGERDWERFVSRHRAQGVLATTFGVTALTILGAAALLWIVPDVTWYGWAIWLAAVVALLSGTIVYYGRLVSRLPQAHLQPSQTSALLEAPDKGTLDGLRDRAMIAVLLNTGMTAEELVAMRLGDLTEMEDGRPAIRVRPQHGGEERVVPFREPYVVAFALKEWVRQAEIKGGVIFRAVEDHNATWRTVSAGAVDAILRRYPVVIDGTVQTVEATELRTAYARYLFEDGADLLTIRERLGCKRVEDVLGFSGPIATHRGLDGS